MAATIQDESTPTPPRIPRAAFITSLAALAFTTGLTVAIIPSLRRNRTRKEGFQFLSNGSLARGAGATAARHKRIPRLNPSTTQKTVPAGTISPMQATTTTTAAPGVKVRSSPLSILDDPHPALHPVHPADPVHEDIGPGDGGISPLFALGAFSIATGIVLVTAGATAYVVARVLDVRDMEEFTSKMRHYTSSILPQNRLYSPTTTPDGAAIPVDHELPEAQDEEDGIVRNWVVGVLGEIEDDRRRELEKRGL
ncbi:hypothetical protein NCC49_001004 [Naganishia albida]|nr:hypothetical protein NCC49_001004 [Naganishia albida]